eukprot:7391813-Prymnesium_polylepis.4
MCRRELLHTDAIDDVAALLKRLEVRRWPTGRLLTTTRLDVVLRLRAVAHLAGGDALEFPPEDLVDKSAGNAALGGAGLTSQESLQALKRGRRSALRIPYE